jgi:hypothetical protein
MKTHADFKRALQTKGVRVITLATAYNAPDSKRVWVGMERLVKKANTTGVYLVMPEDIDKPNNGSFLDYDKASDWVIEGDTATHLEVGYSYRIVLPEKENA